MNNWLLSFTSSKIPNQMWLLCDLGCGNFYSLNDLNRYFIHIVTFDVSPEGEIAEIKF